MYHSKIIAVICIFLHITLTKPLLAMEQQVIEEAIETSFENLPVEMDVEIFEYLSFKQAYICLGACTLWHKILWKMLPGKLGPGSSHETLKECAEQIINHNRKMRKLLFGKTNRTKRRRLNAMLRETITRDYENLQEQKFDVIQCLLKGAYLNAKNNAKQYYSNLILKNNNNHPTDFLFFLLSLGSVLPTSAWDNEILKTCWDITNFNQSTTDCGDELTRLLNKLDGVVVPNFYASESQSAFVKVFHATGRLFVRSYARIFIQFNTTKYLPETSLKSYYFNDDDIDNVEKLLHIHQQLGTNLISLFRNTLERNPNHEILEKLFTQLKISNKMLKKLFITFSNKMLTEKHLPKKNPGKNIKNAYLFLCKKMDAMYIG